MAQSIRIWQKKQLRLDLLTFKQQEMVQVGAAGLLSVFKRLSSSQGPNDSSAKPLTKRYAMYKSRMHKGNRRDLKLTGKMLSNLSLRTVSDNMAKASLTSRKERIKGFANMKREPWLVFSPTNKRVVMDRFAQVLRERMKRMILSKKTGLDLG
jgi:hypothetical protein